MSEYEFYSLINLLKILEEYKSNRLSEDYNNIINDVCNVLELNLANDEKEVKN